MQIRQATLDDSIQISRLFSAGIEKWQRINQQGHVEDLPYERLTIYERWLHGGAWMSIETATLWLNHLVRGAAQALIVEDAAQVVGYAEIFSGDEPLPFGKHRHIGQIISSLPDNDAARETLMQHLLEEDPGVERLTASCPIYDSDKIAFYKRYGFKEIARVQQTTIPAQGAAVGFYKASEHMDTASEQIDEWYMPIGRSTSARSQWENLWPDLWGALPEIVARRTQRQRLSAGGLVAFVCCQQQLYNPRSADIYCWTQKPITGQLMAAIRDWAYKEGYRTLSMIVDDKTAKLLGSDVEMMPQQHIIFGRDL